MHSPLGAVLIYARDPGTTAAFYQRFFGFIPSASTPAGLITLDSPSGGPRLVIHQAAKSVKLGQAGVKLVFSVDDVDGFKAHVAKLGLAFGTTHVADGYAYANAKDPDKNSVSVSSRVFT